MISLIAPSFEDEMDDEDIEAEEQAFLARMKAQAAGTAVEKAVERDVPDRRQTTPPERKEPTPPERRKPTPPAAPPPRPVAAIPEPVDDFDDLSEEEI